MPGRTLDKSKPLITAEGSTGPHRVVTPSFAWTGNTQSRFSFIFSSVQRAVNLSDYCGLSVLRYNLRYKSPGRVNISLESRYLHRVRGSFSLRFAANDETVRFYIEICFMLYLK